MTERSVRDHGAEVRDTIVKSGLTGVAATVLAVAVFSPAGFGGMVGTSVASGFGGEASNASADDPYAVLPAFPAPLTSDELSAIQTQLAQTAVSLEITRAATDDKIEHMRTLALSDGVVTFATVAPSSPPQLRLSLSEPASVNAPMPAPVRATPASFSAGDMAYRDPHLELAELLLAHETY